MKRSIWLVGACVILAGIVFSSAWAELPPGKEFIPRGPQDPMVNPALPLIMTQGGDTAWVNVHDRLEADPCPGDPFRGGEATGGPDGWETWCFEEGADDTTSTGIPGEFLHYDRRTYADDLDSMYWHATTFQAVNPGNMSMWCGGYDNRCGEWVLKTGGYGNYWNQIMQLDVALVAGEDTIDVHNVANGCSLQFATRYVMECNYDYAYVEFYSFKSDRWYPLDNFNGKSGCTMFATQCIADWNNYRKHDKCLAVIWGTAVQYPAAHIAAAGRDYPQYPYSSGNLYVTIPGDSISTTPAATPIRLRWRILTDTALSAADGNSRVKGFWVDDVVVKWGSGGPFDTYTETFNLVGMGQRPGFPWSFPRLEGIYDGWAIRYDMDPPYEGFFLPGPGDSGIPSACEVNASWQWSICDPAGNIPYPDNDVPLPGYHIVMTTPAVPTNYGDEEAEPFAKAGAVVQYDAFQNLPEELCDYSDTWVRTYSSVTPPPYTGAWCEWVNIDGYILFGGGTFWNIDQNEDLTRWSTGQNVDSVQVAFVSLDTGNPGDYCWDPNLPPHKDAQFCVDNVSYGIIDGSATTFTTEARSGRFQDTFNTLTCMHSPNVANNDLRYGAYVLHDKQESLNVFVLDPDGLVGPPGYVKLYYQMIVGGVPGAWGSHNMTLSVPDASNPLSGGRYTATICPDPEWIPGTEILYYLEAKDNLNNLAYYPAESDPGHADYPEYFEVCILPTGGATPLAQDDDATILFVDDFGRSRYDYHPCRSESTLQQVEDFYQDVLEDLGYGYMEAGGYDKYDVGAASSNQRINEPWGFWRADPGNPSEGEKVYDIVIWTTGPYFDSNTIQDTTQGFIQEYTFHGGKIFITGDRILQDLTNPSTSTWPNFMGGTLAAKTVDPGIHPSAFLDSDRYPTCSNEALTPDRLMSPDDSCLLYSGCEILRPEMDKMTINDQDLPAWAHPGGFYIYDDIAAPYDSLAAIYNLVYDEPIDPDTGRVVYMAFSLEAIVDSTGLACDPPPSTAGLRGDYGYGVFQGRSSIVKDVLLWFGEQISVPNVSVGPLGERYVNALQPVQPNPFNPETNVSFSLAARGRVELVVFDVLGRRVTALVDGVQEAGPHMVRWDGRNEAGHPVASGLYFARMETKGFTATEKMTLLK